MVRKVLKILVAIAVLVMVLLVIGGVILNRHIQSPQFKDNVLAAASEKLGAQIKIKEMKISLLSGVTLKSVSVANPKGFDGTILTADAFVLRYSLLPLLRKRMQIDELLLRKPVFSLSRDASGVWNYEKLGAESPPATPANVPAVTTPAAAAISSPVNISLARMELADGQFVMTTETGKVLTRLEDIQVKTSARLEDNRLRGGGTAAIKTINIADSIFLRSVAAPITISTEEVKLSPLSGVLANGKVSGEMTLRLQGGLRYALNAQVRDGDVAKLMQEAGVTKKIINGKLQLTASVQGTGGLPTVTGDGNAQIIGGTLAQVPLQGLLATLLFLPELREIKFDECRLEFAIANNVMQTPVIRVVSPLVQVTGKGSVSLADYSLNHDLTLAIRKGTLLDKLPKEVRAIFGERADGFYALDFKVTGTYDSPKTDIPERIAKGAIKQGIQKGLDELFKKK